MNHGRVLMAVAGRTARSVIRRPVLLSFSLVQPLMWMGLFGFLFQRFRPDTTAGMDYLDFLLPGMCVMAVLFGASQSGIQLIRDMHTGVLQRMLRSAALAPAILAGKLVADVTRILLQAAGVGLVGLLLGAQLAPHYGAAALAGLMIACFGWGFAALSSWVALQTRRQEVMAGFVHLVNMPLIFTSTVLVPTRLMPSWLAFIAQWNPLSICADALRGALLHGQTPAVSAIVALVLWAAFMSAAVWLAIDRFKATTEAV